MILRDRNRRVLLGDLVVSKSGDRLDRLCVERPGEPARELTLDEVDAAGFAVLSIELGERADLDDVGMVVDGATLRLRSRHRAESSFT